MSTFAMLSLISFWLIMFVIHAVSISSSGGGGGGSGGSIKLSSCTLRAGSDASIEAKVGNGDQGRGSYGENGLVY